MCYYQRGSENRQNSLNINKLCRLYHVKQNIEHGPWNFYDSKIMLFLQSLIKSDILNFQAGYVGKTVYHFDIPMQGEGWLNPDHFMIIKILNIDGLFASIRKKGG